jgi:hypothetical protein
MRNVFLNVQQMSMQLTPYIALFIPLYHASKTFKFINTSLLQELAFVLKITASLKAFPFNSTYISMYIYIVYWISVLNHE